MEEGIRARLSSWFGGAWHDKVLSGKKIGEPNNERASQAGVTANMRRLSHVPAATLERASVVMVKRTSIHGDPGAAGATKVAGAHDIKAEAAGKEFTDIAKAGSP